MSTMKSTPALDPRRWREGAADRSALEARAADLADAASSSPPLSGAALVRIRNGVQAARSGATRSRPVGVFVVAGLIVFCVTTVGGAAIVWRRSVAPPPAPRPAPETAPARYKANKRLTAAPPVEIPASSDIVLAPAAPEESERQEARRPTAPSHRIEWPARANTPAPLVEPAGREVVPPPFAGAIPSPPTATEAALVGEALRALRQDRNPRAALSVLDRYAQAFPNGVLETEAFRTRVEAVIGLGDTSAALGLLDRASSPDLIGAELLLTRAELRAGAGRFREALADLDALVAGRAGPLAPGSIERLLYGRAICLERLGHSGPARAALVGYRERFPNGRFAAEVDRLLAAPAAAPGP